MTHIEIVIADHIGVDMATITKYFLVVMLLSGCVTKFDNTEYEYLTLLDIALDNTTVCSLEERQQIHALTDFLYRYTEYSTDRIVSSVYDNLHSMTVQFVKMESVSIKYCEIKINNISRAVDSIRMVHGKRLRG